MQEVRAERLRVIEKGGWIRPSKHAPTQGGHMAAKFVLKKGSTGKFRFNLVAINGR